MPKYALRHCGWRCVASGRELCGLLGGEFVGSARLSTRFFQVPGFGTDRQFGNRVRMDQSRGRAGPIGDQPFGIDCRGMRPMR
jgi:hypothetical protein